MAPKPGSTRRLSRAAILAWILAVALIGVTTTLVATLAHDSGQSTKTVYRDRVVSAAGPDWVTIGPTWHNSAYDDYKIYRTRPSYLGPLAMADLKPGVNYYVPNEAELIHTGDDRWFMRDLSTPVLANASDAGPYPYKLQAIGGEYRYMDGNGSYLQLTLPSRYDFGLSSDNHGHLIHVKGIYGPSEDVRDAYWNRMPFISVASVLPAPGLDLHEYYVPIKAFGTLPIDGVGYMDITFLKQVGGTSLGYLENMGYQDHVTPVHNGFIKLKRTDQGLMACTNPALTLGERVQHVPLNYTPTASETRVTVAARC